MHRLTRNAAFALVLFAALALLGFGCSKEARYNGDGDGYDGEMDTTRSTWPPDTGRDNAMSDTMDGVTENGSTIEIIIQDDQYGPMEQSVMVGTTVTWVNRDLYPHTVTAGKPGKPSGAFDSGNMQKDMTYSYTFDSVGTYEYYCKIHPTMRGKVIVEEK